MGGYLSKPVENASVENNGSDILSIPMEDAQHGTVEPSDNLSIEPTTTDIPAVEEAFLTEISANKKWIAHVVEKSEANQDKQFSLRIKNITYPFTGPTFSEGLEKDITGCMQGVDGFTYCFLSLSLNGDRVAISFWRFNSDRKFTKKPTCYVFRVDESEIKPEKEIECQGMAVFTPDGYLAFVHKNILDLYNCRDDYKFTRSLDIERLFFLDAQVHNDIHPGADKAIWKSSFNGSSCLDVRSRKTMFHLQTILYLTRFVKYNLLVPCFRLLPARADEYSYEGICVWSLTDGVKSIPSKTENEEEVFAISSDKTLVATSGNELTYLHVHQLKSGLLVSKLKSVIKIQAKQQDYQPPQLPILSYYVHFSKNNEYVFLITIRGNTARYAKYKALLMIEAWNRNAEKSIFQYKKVIEVDWNSKYNLQPYIIESEHAPGTFTAVYATRSENGGCLLESLELKLFEGETNNGWRVIPYHKKEIDKFMKRVRVMSLDLKGSDIRYLLCFGKSTVELWRHYRSVDQRRSDLVYIRAFHPPHYHQGEAFKEDWILENYNEIRFENEFTSQLLPLDIRFIRTQYRVVLDIEYNSNIRQEGRSIFNNVQTHQDDIYLPLGALEQFKEQEIPEFFCTDFHFIESTCRALHFLYQRRRKTKDDQLLQEITELFQQTKGLVERSIEEMKKEKSRYFTTISGSNTLAMLASFQDGRNIIFQILQTDELPVNLFTHVRKFAITDNEYGWVARKENALTILIEQFDYELFNLFFNRVLLHATKLGVGAFCPISDTLIFLRERSETGILQASCQKLKFLTTETNPYDSKVAMDLDLLRNSINAEFSDFPSYGVLEQLPTYNSTSRLQLLFWAQQYAIKLNAAIVKRLRFRRPYNYYDSSSMPKSMARTNLLSVCAVPFIDFSSYTISWEDVEFDPSQRNRDDKTWTARLNAALHKLFYPSNTKEKIIHKTESDLMQLASNQQEDDLFHQKGSVIEVLLYYKWKTFIRKRFYLVCLVHLVYYLSFCFGVLFARECLAYTLGTWISGDPRHVALIVLMLTSNFILSTQELLQFLKIGFWRYVKSIYNIIDLVSLIMPLVSFWLMITGNNSLDQVSAIATIILWMHGILRLRPFAFIGVTVETVIQLMKSVYKTLIIMLIVIFAFTHAFIVLLLHKDDTYFQEQYSGSFNITDIMSDDESAASYSDTSASNSFTNVFKAFSTLWLFIYGVWDPITNGDAGDDFMIIVFAMLFSFITVLLFFNLVVTRMSSKAEEVKSMGKSIWLSHFAEVIAEIEQFWCFRFEKINRNNSPSVVYYIAKYTDVRQQAESLEQNCDSLIKELQIKLDKRQRASCST